MNNKIYSVYLLTEDVPWVGYTENIYDRMCNHKSNGRITNLKSYRVLYTTTDKSEAKELEALLHDEGYLGKHYGGKIAVESGQIFTISKARRKLIRQYNKSGEFIKEFISTLEASNELNLSNGNLNQVLKGKRKSAGGFTFRYVNELAC